MNITFGIITTNDKEAQDRVTKIIENIKLLNIPNYEIVVVGGPNRSDVKYIPFTELSWISAICHKKNLITQHSSYENIVYSHDYVTYHNDWYQLWKLYDSECVWHVGTNRICNQDGSRFRDLVLWDYPNENFSWTCCESWCPPGGIVFRGKPCLPSYTLNVNNYQKYIAVNGTWWIAKRDFMIEYPLNETIGWAMGEDIEWSLRWRSNDNIKYVFNPLAKCILLKQKEAVFPIREDIV